MIFTLIIVGTIVLLSIPGAIVFIPLAVLTGNVNPLYRVGSWIAHFGLLMGGIRFRIQGRDRVPRDRACIFMANHVSNLDPPALLPVLPGRTSVFLKKSLMKLPVLGYGFRLGNFIPVERAGNPEQAKKNIAAAVGVLRQGVHITTFVEGTRSRDGRMLPFKKGPFYLAKESGALCVPVSIYGTESMMAKGSMAIKPGTVHIVFHEPIDPAGFPTREELMAAVRVSIASGLPEWMRT
jgi:1-acyl-sn-glycerol-3-phosphate acyltransferase